MTRIFWIRPQDPPERFPHPARAYRDPDGLLAAGGDLSPARLLYAYRHGIFPWYSEGEPVLWWSPDPRSVFLPGGLHVSRRLARLVRQERFEIRLNTRFAAVLEGCAGPRAYGDGTWITHDMHAAYLCMHERGHAHSIEAWQGEDLVGGLYGIAIGRVFFGESMWSAERDASKVVLAHLARYLEFHEFGLIDCQVQSGHLARLGSEAIPRDRFLRLLDIHCERPSPPGIWAPGTRLPVVR